MARKKPKTMPMWLFWLWVLYSLIMPACSVQPPADPLWLEQHEAERAEYWPLWRQACLRQHWLVVREDAQMCPLNDDNCLPDRTDWDFGWRENPKTHADEIFFKTRRVYCARP